MTLLYKTKFTFTTYNKKVKNTQKAIAAAICMGKPAYQENYIKHPYKCPIIVGLIKEYLQNK